MTTIKSRYLNLGAMLRATPRVDRGGSSIPGILSLTVLPYFRHSAQKYLSGKEHNVRPLSPAFLLQTGFVLGRSFFPLFAIAVIAGSALWGPWVSLTVTALAIAAALRLL